MTDGCVIAAGAISAFGSGPPAYRAWAEGEPARSAVAPDDNLIAAGLAGAMSARAPAAPSVTAANDRATNLLVAALRQLTAELDERLVGWRERRLGVCLGSSSGGMLSAEVLFACRAHEQQAEAAVARRATYFAPLQDALCAVGLCPPGDADDRSPPAGRPAPMRCCQVLAACASSTIAVGLGLRWLEREACDIVLVGGYDAVSTFVAAGFAAIRAISSAPPQPFRCGRDGMVLGEGAAVMAMVREGVGPRPLFRVSGFGASADAVHITAPDRTGAGLARAGRAALSDAGGATEPVDLVSAHATATPYNDAAEAKAIGALCGPNNSAPVHPFKAQIGHTLGAAGVLETLAAGDALASGVAPAAFGQAPIDPGARVTLLERATRRPLRTALKLSAAFGGVTAALVLRREPSRRPLRPRRAVCLVGWQHVTEVDRTALSASTGMARDRLARIDDLGQLALGAVAALAEQVGAKRLAGAGVVGGYGLATLDTNERFYARLLKKGARWVDPRLFPATSPNSGPGHCAIAFGLTGPNFAVSSGLCGSFEALMAAAELVAAADAPRMVVVAADDDGPAARQWLDRFAAGRPHARGAVAVLIEACSDDADPSAIDLDATVDHHRGPVGQLALLRWLEQRR